MSLTFGPGSLLKRFRAGSYYSNTSVARTPMARLPQPFQTRSGVPREKNPIGADIIIFGIIIVFFFFILIMAWCVYSLESPR